MRKRQKKKNITDLAKAILLLNRVRSGGGKVGSLLHLDIKLFLLKLDECDIKFVAHYIY